MPGSGIALLVRPTCRVVSLASHCFLSHRVSYETWSSPILLEWLTSKAHGSSCHCLPVLGWWACSQYLTSYVAVGDPNSGSHAGVASTTLSHFSSPVHVTESKLLGLVPEDGGGVCTPHVRPCVWSPALKQTNKQTPFHFPKGHISRKKSRPKL